jgi:hypothetical protein
MRKRETAASWLALPQALRHSEPVSGVTRACVLLCASKWRWHLMPLLMRRPPVLSRTTRAAVVPLLRPALQPPADVER